MWWRFVFGVDIGRLGNIILNVKNYKAKAYGYMLTNNVFVGIIRAISVVANDSAEESETQE